ncbi:MAG: glycosyltransferase family 4 protein [Arachnia sp.]
MKGPYCKKITNEAGVSVLWVRSLAYGRSTIRRFLGMASFAINLLIPSTTRELQRPDIVIGSTVHPLAAWAGWCLAKRHRVPFVYEIRDVWPDALIHLGSLGSRNPIARWMAALSLHLAKKSQLVLSPLPAVHRYLSDNGIVDKPFLWVSNGYEGQAEVPAPMLPIRDSFTFMYLGSHGNANALDGILEAFDMAVAQEAELDLRLRLVGDGPLKPELRSQADRLASCDRILFEERIPRSEVTERAREADCLTANLHDSPVYNYGISPNKLFHYLYAYRPVVFACSAPNNPIQEAQAGIVVPGDNREELAAAFVKMARTPHETRATWAANGYSNVTQNYASGPLAAKLAEGLERVLDHWQQEGGR